MCRRINKISKFKFREIKAKSGNFCLLLDVLKAHTDFQEAYLHGVVKFFGNEFLQAIRDYYEALFNYNTEEIKYSDIDEYGGAVGAGMLSLYYGPGGVKID